MTCLPDVNVWVALAVAEHVHHREAVQWFEAAEEETIALCRVTQMGLLRLLTNARVMGEDALTASGAWGVVDAFFGDSRIVFAPEPAALEPSWRVLTRGRPRATSLWTDAYLAAFASLAQYTLVTFDNGFTTFKSLRLQLLAPRARSR